MELLKTLLTLSEKAANIARVCRQDGHLFELLIQKKKCNEANPRFVEDFKTLADVLIQEMVKHDIKNKFQELSNNIFGEENNSFSNKLGEKIIVEVKPTEQETSALLATVLNGDYEAAKLLAAEVHREINVKDIKTTIPEEDFQLKLEELSIWIDPIDGTAEYINGGKGNCDRDICRNGLNCITILIGVFNRTSGMPVMGVVNRPFIEEGDFGWPQQCIWGVSVSNFSANSGLNSTCRNSIICISSSEKLETKRSLEEKGFSLVEACGAGYKILTVVLGLADAYVLTSGTTFKWDTCAPHAVLRSLGGDIVSLRETVLGTQTVLTYFTKERCNLNGIIAYRDKDVLCEIVSGLKYLYN